MANRLQVDLSVNPGNSSADLDKAASSAEGLEQSLQGVTQAGQSAEKSVDQAGQAASKATEEFNGLVAVLNEFLGRRAREVGQQVNLFSQDDVEVLRAIRAEFQGYVKERANIPNSLGSQLKASGQIGVKSPEQIQQALVERNPQKFQQTMDRALGRILAAVQTQTGAKTGLTTNELTHQGGQVGPAGGGAGGPPNPKRGQGEGDPDKNPDKKPDQRRRGLFQAARYLAEKTQSGVGGVAGQVLGSGASGAARGMAGMLPGGLAGGAMLGVAGLGLFKAASAINEGHSRAEQESIDLGLFKRQLGDVGVDFEDLRNQLRSVSDGLGLTFEQSRKLAISFSQTADIRDGTAPAEIAGQTRVSAEFARSTGVNEEAMARFFGEMRSAKTTDDVKDSRKLSMAMADAIKRSGSSVNADKMLESIAGYTAQMRDATHNKVNTEGYADALSRLIGTGMTAGSASGVLSRFDAGVRSGGNSEASEALIFQALDGNKLGAGRSYALRQAGLFGTEKNTLGDPNSPIAKYYGVMEGGSDVATITKILAQIEKQAPGDSKEAKEAKLMGLADGYLGGNQAEAAVILNMKDKFGAEGLNKTAGMLGNFGIDTSKVNIAGLSTLAEVANAPGMQDLKDVRQRMLQRKDLKAGDKTALEGSFSEADPEKLRRLLAITAASYGSEGNQGDALKDIQANTQNQLQEIATKLIPATLMMRDLLGEMVKKSVGNDNPVAKDLARQKQLERNAVTPAMAESGAVSAGTIDEINDEYDRKIEKAGSKKEKRDLELQRHKQLGSKAGKYPLIFGGLGKEELEEVKKEAAAAPKKEADRTDLRQGSWTEQGDSQAATGKPPALSKSAAARAEKLLPEISKAESTLGLNSGTLAGLFQHESAFKTDVFGTGVDKNGQTYTSRAHGLGQMTPGAKKEVEPEFQKMFGRESDDSNPADQIYMSGMYYRNRLKKQGSYEKANQAYFAGDGGVDGSGKVSASQVREYGADVAAKQSAWAKKMATTADRPPAPAPATEKAAPAKNPTADRPPAPEKPEAKTKPGLLPAVPVKTWFSTGPGDVPQPDVREQGAKKTPVQVPSGNPQEQAESNRRSLELSMSPLIVSGNFTLSDQQQRPVADPVKVSSVVRKPLGSGATGGW